MCDQGNRVQSTRTIRTTRPAPLTHYCQQPIIPQWQGPQQPADITIQYNPPRKNRFTKQWFPECRTCFHFHKPAIIPCPVYCQTCDIEHTGRCIAAFMYPPKRRKLRIANDERREAERIARELQIQIRHDPARDL